MTDVFSQVLNMSLTGSTVIIAVILARCCMRRLPKIFSYALWSVVLFRLLCPVSVSGPGSLLELLNPRVQEATDAVSVVSYLPMPEELPEFQYVPAELPQTQSGYTEVQLTPMYVFGCIWVVGVGVMGIYALVQYLLLKKRLIGAVLYRDRIYLADHLNTAFVMGVVSPKIYLPSHVPASERKYILAHEHCHIRRGDHVIKLLAYTALCVHWFNPLVWTAFLMAGKDMEMSCDEAVIRQFGSGIRAEYSASLLRLAAHRKPVPGMPLAFGEGDTKGRILNMAKWKKPKLWMSILCGILCIAFLVACAINPEKEQQAETDIAKPSHMETVVSENEDLTNILLVFLPDEEGAAKLGDTMLVLTSNQKDNSLTIQSIPGDEIVNLPDYKSHITGNEPVRVCYALGYTWGGRTAAMQMVNQCAAESFGYSVNYNAEFTWDDVKTLIDSMGGIRVSVEERELPMLAELDDPVLRDARAGILRLEGDTAVAYAYPRSNEENPAVAEASRLRQRKLLAAVISAVRDNSQVAAQLPALYPASDLEMASGEWSDILGYMDGDTSFYLAGMETEREIPIPPVSGSDIVTDTELVQYGDLKLLLPSGYSSRADGTAVVLSKEGNDVGGINCYRTPDIPLEYSIEYLRAMGLPEAQETEEPVAWMISSNTGGGIVAEFFHELKPETLNAEHNFYFSGDLVYDVYFDQNILSDAQASAFLKTIELGGTPVEPSAPEAHTSRILCRNVLDLVRSGPYQIAIERKNQGEYILNNSSSTVYTSQGNNWLSITHVPDDDSYHGFMKANGINYSNEGRGWNEDGSVRWEEDPYPDDVYVPWLASFQWREDVVTYIDTVMESGRKIVMLRIDEPFQGYEDLSNCYFVNMNFTEDGRFLNTDIHVVFPEDSDVSYVEISESIVSLDQTVVTIYIENEINLAARED